MAAAGGGYWLLRVFAETRAPGAGDFVEIDLPEGLSERELASFLDQEGLITSAPLFALYLRLRGGTESFHPGPHLLRDNLSPRSLEAYLERSGYRERKRVMLPEGVHLFSMAKRFYQAGVVTETRLLDAMMSEELLSELGIEDDSFEGYLFPATYEFHENSEPREIILRLKGELDKRLDRLEARYPEAFEGLRREFGWGRREIIVLASIVEKEAGVDEERPLIASVFFNRLRDPKFLPRKRLQSDVTTAYGCIKAPELAPSCASYAGRVLPEMNNDIANPYSTYRHSDLPPGPIANPGEKSLEAVLAPAETKYFYFVARGGGHHAFSETLDQHRAAIRGR